MEPDQSDMTPEDIRKRNVLKVALAMQAGQAANAGRNTLQPNMMMPSFSDPTDAMGYYGGMAINELIKNYQRISEIYKDEVDKHPGRDNADDAMRHAETSMRIANEMGPFIAWAAGAGHEVGDFFKPDFNPLSTRMDLYNNSVGRAATQAGKPIDPNALRVSPGDARPSVQNRYDTKGYRLR